MNFDTSDKEVFEIEGSSFSFNHDRTEYLANEILDSYESQIKLLGKNIKELKKKKKAQVCGDIYALYSEWNLENNDETLYLLFSESEDEVFTHLTTDNEHYPNLIENDL